MNFLTKMFGSKYEKKIPYTYQAVVNVVADDDSIQISYLADRICTLTNFLKKQHIAPDSVTIFEVYNGKETLISKELYMSEEGIWLPKTNLCHPMTSRYGEPKDEHTCQFRDRTNRIAGPC
ncbi:hypothetical protein [Candidatus Parabeggiatoa sp. HSG14]|uniref:hypothetical protein n=1 Tax=Candidatus Parabeggiatoa sp. HSG14 TaxID=3055593 RepID=UPI0025A884F1|nr:hypothetical protein [Thiotrichales bacterium HSG14]